MGIILHDEKLDKFVSTFFKVWEKDIFSIILVPKRKKVTCFVNGIKQYEFDKEEIIKILSLY